jgi:hypothetical protein
VLRIARRPAADKSGMFRCPAPAHDDSRPSARVQPSRKGWVCHACGARGGVLDLAVMLGVGSDRAAAACALEHAR